MSPDAKIITAILVFGKFGHPWFILQNVKLNKTSHKIAIAEAYASISELGNQKSYMNNVSHKVFNSGTSHEGAVLFMIGQM
jgi:hypothetical protein